MNKIFIVLLFFYSLNALSAGFDCEKALRKTEKMVCENVELSNLDRKMAGIYKAMASKSKNSHDLIRQQRDWLLNERDSCSTVQCLKDTYLTRISQLTSIGQNNEKCAIDEEKILGTWVAANRMGNFEEMFFGIEGNEKVFMSWLHHQPEMPGAWEIRNCAIHISSSSLPKISFDYTIKNYANKILYLQENGSSTVLTYKKLNN